MTLAELVPLVLKASIVLLVFSFALEATGRDALHLFRRPAQLGRALLSIYVVMPVLAVVLALAFDLHPEIKLALGALAISPVPPFLPGKARKAGGEPSYTIGLLAASSLLAVIIVPLLMLLIDRLLLLSHSIPTLAIAEGVFVTVLAPLTAGIVVHSAAPDFAKRIARPAAFLANLMLLASLVAMLAGAWHAMLGLIGHGTIIAIVAFVLAGLAVGHLLGGPRADDRPVLALATSARHPAVAIAIAHSSYPDMKTAPAAVLLYLLVCTIATIPYMQWIKRREAGVIHGV